MLEMIITDPLPNPIPPDGVLVHHGFGIVDYLTGCGQMLVNVHAREECDGRPCIIHDPSDHPLRDCPTFWRTAGPFDIKPSHMERICPHGIGHPDPDSPDYEDLAVHGCDGCCL